MRSNVCLLALLLIGVGLALLPVRFLEYGDMSSAPRWLPLWFYSLHWFAVPFCLICFGFFQPGRFIAWCRTLWGMWVTALSLGVLVHIREAPPFHSSWGTLAVIGVLVFSLALSVFSVADATR